MQRSIKVAVLVIFTVLAVFDLPGLEDTSTILPHIRYFSSVFPRFPGTKGEKAALSYLKEHLGTLPYQEESLLNFEDAHSFSKNLGVTIRGKSSNTLLVVIPLDQNPEGEAGEGDFALSLGLGIAERYGSKKTGSAEPPLTITILFAGDEYLGSFDTRIPDTGGDTRSRLGLRRYIEERAETVPLSVLYLSFPSIPRRVFIETGTRGELAPSWLVGRCVQSLERSGLPFSLPGSETQMIRLKVDAWPSGIGPFLSSGIPAVGISGADAGSESDAEEVASAFFAFLDDFIEQNSEGYPGGWDRHSLFFRMSTRSLIVGETVYIIILLFVSGLLILYPLLSRERFFRYARILGEHIWSLPLLYAVMFGFFLLSTRILELLLSFRNFPLLYRYVPFEFITLKMLIAGFFFVLTSRLFFLLPFSKRGSFYSASALLFLVIDTIIVSFIDISLTYYVLWALVFAFLFSITSFRILKGILLLLSPVMIVKGIIDVVRLPAYEAVRVILLSRVSGNLLGAFILLPFVLMLIRVMLMFRHPVRRTRRLLRFITDSVLFIVASGLFLYIFHFDPFSPSGPKPIGFPAAGAMPVHAEVFVDYESALTETRIEGAAPLGTILAEGFGFFELIHTGDRSVSFPRNGVPDILSVSVSESRFLDRKTIYLTIESRGTIRSLDLRVQSPEDYVIYDSSYPLTRGLPGEPTVFHIGSFPPRPFTLDFTTDSSFSGTVAVNVGFWDVPLSLDVKGEHMALDRSVRARRSVRISR